MQGLITKTIESCKNEVDQGWASLKDSKSSEVHAYLFDLLDKYLPLDLEDYVDEEVVAYCVDTTEGLTTSMAAVEKTIFGKVYGELYDYIVSGLFDDANSENERILTTKSFQ